MARPPDQTTAALHDDREHLERIFKRAQQNEKRPKLLNQRVLTKLRELIEIYRKDAFAVETADDTEDAKVKRRA